MIKQCNFCMKHLNPDEKHFTYRLTNDQSFRVVQEAILCEPCSNIIRNFVQKRLES